MEGTKYSIGLQGCDDNADKFYNIKFVQGRKPSKDNEIALEKWILPYLKKDYKVGDKIKLKYELKYLGRRKVEIVEREFTVSGIFNYTSADFNPVAIGWVTMDFAAKELGGKRVIYHGRLDLKPKYSIEDGALALEKDRSYNEINFYTTYNKLAIMDYEKQITWIINFLAIIFGIVSTVNIYNAFAVSVVARKKQFGILRAIGATSNKIKGLVLIEGLIIGLIFIPLGIIVGNSLIRIVMILLGNESVSFLFDLSKKGAIVSFIIGTFSILIGCYFPAKKAAEITPMEAINRTERINFKKGNITIEDVKIRGRKVKFPTVMAIANVKRNKKRFITSVISLSMTLFLVICGYYFIKLVDVSDKLKDSYGATEFKVETYKNAFDSRELKEIESIEGATVYSKVKHRSAMIFPSKERITKEGLQYLQRESERSPENKERFEKGDYSLASEIYVYDDDMISKFKNDVIDGSIKNSIDEPVVYVVQGLNNQNYTDIKVGDEIEVSFDKYDEGGKKVGRVIEWVKVGALIKQEALKEMYVIGNSALIINKDVAAKHLDLKGYNLINMTLDNDKKYEETYKNVEKTVNEIRGGTFESLRER